MDNIYIVAIITIGVVAVLFLVMPFFYKKFAGFDFNALFGNTNNVLEAIKVIIDNVAIPEDKKQILELITKYAIQAVRYAEQLYLSGQLDEKERKQKAVEYVQDILTLSNVEITEDINKIIDATVEASVLLLPKTNGNFEDANL